MKTDNELIAAFMGLPLTKEELLFEPGRRTRTVPFTNWKYDTSWDWLMPVVEKINNLPFESSRGTEILHAIRKYINLVQIADAHMYVVEFIKWFNENGKK